MSKVGSDEEGDDRRYAPCPRVTLRFDDADLVHTCDSCGRFYARCCHHMRKTCHHLRVVYTDGACLNNGQSDAVAGIGIAFGRGTGDPEEEDTQQFSFPVDERLDPGKRRTNQRAELLAALEGLKRTCRYDEEKMAIASASRPQGDPLPSIIITTDSEYVVKGMTEWLPIWKENGLRTSKGQRPANLDLFLKLDAEVERRERIHDCRVQFWHVNREYNTVADALAKRGARAATNTMNEHFGQVVSAFSSWSL